MPIATPPQNWILTFSDEFNGAAGAPVDVTKWTSDSGPWSANGELEYYSNVTNTNAPGYTTKNAFQDGNGNLVIAMYAETAAGRQCWYGPCAYTSARLKTQGLFQQQYGRMEARIKIPLGQGLWPAFWMQGTFDVNQTANAEIDVMETIGKFPSTVYGAAHGPGYSDGPITVYYILPNGRRLADDYHLYAVEWSASPPEIRYYLDDVQYAVVSPDSIPAGSQYVFTRPLYLMLNLAVGGNFAGSPDASTPFPAQMLVDYVRVYRSGSQ